MNDYARSCLTCVYWDPDLCEPDTLHGSPEATEPCLPLGSQTEGKCRRRPPVLAPRSDAGPYRPAALWPPTLALDWCGEWEPRHAFLVDEEPALDPEEERCLRNSSIAQALMMLPEEKRDKLLLDVLTEEERNCPSPPDDFYERVQSYFALQREAEARGEE